MSGEVLERVQGTQHVERPKVGRWLSRRDAWSTACGVEREMKGRMEEGVDWLWRKQQIQIV